MSTYNQGIFNNKPRHELPPLPDLVWEPCATCWGQGRIYSQISSDEIQLAVERGGEEFADRFRGKMWKASCPSCLGTGTTLGGAAGDALKPI